METPELTHISRRTYLSMRAAVDWAKRAETPEQQAAIKAEFKATADERLRSTEQIAVDSDEMKALSAEHDAIPSMKMMAAQKNIFDDHDSLCEKIADGLFLTMAAHSRTLNHPVAVLEALPAAYQNMRKLVVDTVIGELLAPDAGIVEKIAAESGLETNTVTMVWISIFGELLDQAAAMPGSGDVLIVEDDAAVDVSSVQP